MKVCKSYNSINKGVNKQKINSNIEKVIKKKCKYFKILLLSNHVINWRGERHLPSNFYLIPVFFFSEYSYYVLQYSFKLECNNSQTYTLREVI